MLILGIESSCDETGAAIIRDGRYLLSNVVASQAEIHDRYGGVVPEVASRQQLTTIIPVLEMALEQAGCGWENIDAVAATYGPGLAGSLSSSGHCGHYQLPAGRPRLRPLRPCTKRPYLLCRS